MIAHASLCFLALLRRATHHDEVVGIPHQFAQMRTLPHPDPVEKAQIDVREQRRDHASLRRSRNGAHLPSLVHHPCLQPLPHQPQHPPVAHPTRHPLHQQLVIEGTEEVADVCFEDVVALPVLRSTSSACVALRRGRNPYEQSLKSASKIGSRISFVAICTTRSRTVGMPNGRFRPSAFGMYRRRTIAAGTCLLAARSGSLRGSDLRRAVGCSRSSQHRLPLHPCSASLASTLPGERHLLQIRSYNA